MLKIRSPSSKPKAGSSSQLLQSVATFNSCMMASIMTLGPAMTPVPVSKAAWQPDFFAQRPWRTRFTVRSFMATCHRPVVVELTGSHAMSEPRRLEGMEPKETSESSRSSSVASHTAKRSFSSWCASARLPKKLYSLLRDSAGSPRPTMPSKGNKLNGSSDICTAVRNSVSAQICCGPRHTLSRAGRPAALPRPTARITSSEEFACLAVLLSSLS
mmetsp:Transcript_27453/g.65238  ORF Transcript_27453/g.65238 Transcript_27453/m.65238 type:complete len:215 (-) Transcript_27453:336-980(-)